MRIIARSTLRDYWERYPDTEIALKVLFTHIKKASWKNFNDLKAQFGNASVVGNDRVVFNVKGNEYRLITAIDYQKQIAWVRFIGTHKEYDKIDAKKI